MTATGCPFPDRCPVPDPPDESTFDEVVLAPATWTSVGSVTHRRLLNSAGRGDARFSPLDDDGVVVPTLYLARNGVTALLETVLHELGPHGAGRVAESELVGRQLRRVELPALRLVDLRDAGLVAAGLDRAELISASAAHYPCTRAWASWIRARHPDCMGLVWHSRVAEVAPARPLTVLGELLPGESSEVAVVFGDRLVGEPTASDRTPLDTADGLALVVEIVVDLGGIVDG